MLLLALAVVAVVVVVEGDALAQKSKSRAPRGVITLDVVTITGRIQKPIAAVDVARIRPTLTLSELRQPFLKRITAAIYKAPF
ncbi:MAG TPA: hypothetical protein ENK23_03700 [Sorangium sp.]|nr:hypothetical protein [Sorangium sp.]